MTPQNIVAFEKMLETTPDPRTGKLRHPNTVVGYLSSFRGVFTIAVQRFLIDTNPIDSVAVSSKIDSKRQPYSVRPSDLDIDPCTGGDRQHIFAATGASLQRLPGLRNRRLQHARFQFRSIAMAIPRKSYQGNGSCSSARITGSRVAPPRGTPRGMRRCIPRL